MPQCTPNHHNNKGRKKRERERERNMTRDEVRKAPDMRDLEDPW
jgi:hypothetical protein